MTSVLYIYVNKKSPVIPESSTIACYSSLVAVKPSIRFRYLFVIKSFKKVRLSERKKVTERKVKQRCNKYKVILEYFENLL